jgi:hypothetical protein
VAPIVTRQIPLIAGSDLWDFIGTGDPGDSPGVPAAIGSRFSATDGALGTVLFVKYGPADTDWSNTLGGSGGGGGGGSGVTSVTGTAPITASPTSGAVVVSHDASGVVAGTYGDATTVPQLTFDAKGHVTAAVPVAITYAGAFVPTYIAPAETFTVPENRQAPYVLEIDVDTGGTLAVDGFLIEVD